MLCLCDLLLQSNAVPSSLSIKGSNESNSSFLDLSSPHWMLQVCYTHTHTHTHTTDCTIKLAVLISAVCSNSPWALEHPDLQ